MQSGVMIAVKKMSLVALLSFFIQGVAVVVMLVGVVVVMVEVIVMVVVAGSKSESTITSMIHYCIVATCATL